MDFFEVYACPCTRLKCMYIPVPDWQAVRRDYTVYMFRFT